MANTAGTKGYQQEVNSVKRPSRMRRNQRKRTDEILRWPGDTAEWTSTGPPASMYTPAWPMGGIIIDWGMYRGYGMPPGACGSINKAVPRAW